MTGDIPIRCTDCGDEPELQRNPGGRLFVGCECGGRSVRVKKALPVGWEDV